MAAGRTPKAPGARARRNQDQASWKPVEGGAVPAWPGTKKDPPEAIRFWKTAWEELGGMWSRADEAPVFRAALLHAAVISSGRKKTLATRLTKIARSLDGDEADFVRALALDFAFGSPDTAAAKELRELEDRLGISPMSRRRLQWELKRATGKAPDAAAPGTDSGRKRRTTSGNVLEALQ